MKLNWFLMGAAIGGMLLVNAAAAESRREHFESGRHRINVDVFGPADARAKVVVLPGAGGMMFDGPQVKGLARELAERGIAAYVVNYFNRTNDWFVLGDAGLVRGFSTWADVVDDAVDWVSSKNAGRPVGLYGYSLGGFLAVSESAGNERVGAVVSQSGGIWDKFVDVDGALPPILVVHGTADDRVYFERNTGRIRKVAERHGTEMETLYLEGEKHRLSDAAQVRVNQAAGKFFSKVLGD